MTHFIFRLNVIFSPEVSDEKKVSFSSARNAAGIYTKRLINEVVKCNYTSLFNIASNATLES